MRLLVPAALALVLTGTVGLWAAQAARQAAVPPTVSPSISKVG